MGQQPFLQRTRIVAPPALAALFALGGALLLGAPEDRLKANLVWLTGLVVLGGPVVWRTLRDAVRGHFATDIVAAMAIMTSVVLAQPLAGLIVVLMQTGGEALERYAEGRASQAVRRLGSAALDLCYVAAGRFDGYWEERVQPWDIAAGALIVEEAGGRVTGLAGQPFDPFTGHIVATNGRLHAPVLDVIHAAVEARARIAHGG